jgi:hypothetical protein
MLLAPRSHPGELTVNVDADIRLVAFESVDPFRIRRWRGSNRATCLLLIPFSFSFSFSFSFRFRKTNQRRFIVGNQRRFIRRSAA